MLVLLGLVAIPARAEAEPTASDPNYYAPLKPSDLIYQLDGTTATNPDDTAITLHKQAVRTGPTEWTVDVSATVKSEKVEQREFDVVFVLDASGSMAWCADEVAHTSSGHKHTNQCSGNKNLCGLDNHQHSWNNNCYSKDKCTYETHPDHYTGSGRNRKHRTDLTCLNRNGSYYALTCTQTAHSHSDTCKLKCGKTAASHSNVGEKPCSYTDVKGTHNYPTRLEVAKDAISTLADSLPSYVEPKYVAFSSKGYINNTYDAIVMENYDTLQARGATKMMAGVNLGIDQFSNNENTKILVVVTDGASEDGYTSTKYENFTQKGGVVFTVGFNHDNANLKGMIANGGAYYQATNPGELIDALEDINAKLSAMIEDPMGDVVGFDKSGFQDKVQTNIGEVTYVGDTIYWNPSTENENISQIRYSYEVTLDAETDINAAFHTVGAHSQVLLNNTTYFHYSVDSDSRAVKFPIPQAAYAISSLQTTWRTTDNIILAATNKTETVIAPTTAYTPEKIVGCDFKNEDGSWYFTGFTQDYAIKDSFTDNGATYLYVRTEITINGGEPIVVQTAKALEELVKAYEPNAYQVVHLYEKNMPLKLTVSKIVSGNMGSRNSKFDFTVTLPDMAGQTVGCTLGNTPTTLTLDVQGKASFSLSHDQTLVMNNVHGNYQVEEAPYGSYVTTVSVNDGQAEQKNSVMGKLDASNTYVAYTNSLDATIPTGVFTSSASALAGLLLSVVMFTITRAGRRARDDE